MLDAFIIKLIVLFFYHFGLKMNKLISLKSSKYDTKLSPILISACIESTTNKKKFNLIL